MPFDSDVLELAALPDGTFWTTRADITYTGHSDTWTIPRGFHTDLASVPLALTWLAPRYGTYTRAAVLHDWLCRLADDGEIGRADADGVLRRVLGELGVSNARRYLMWAAVRVGSRLVGATWRERLQVAGIGALAVPFLFLPTSLVWIGQRLFGLLER